jgi:biotin transporter BioY
MDLSRISGRKGIVAGLAVLAVLGIVMLMYHFTLFAAGFTLIYIAAVAMISEYIDKHYRPGDIIMAALILVAAGIYALVVNYFRIYDFSGFITMTIMSAVLWTVVAEPIAAMFRTTTRRVARHYVEEAE